MPKSQRTAPDFEELAMTYQTAEIALLNSVLKACGIRDKRKRGRICDEFAFALGEVLDEGAFQSGGKWFAPVLSYEERAGNPEDGFRRLATKYSRPGSFPGYHECALSNVAQFFEDWQETADFDWGPEYEP